MAIRKKRPSERPGIDPLGRNRIEESKKEKRDRKRIKKNIIHTSQAEGKGTSPQEYAKKLHGSVKKFGMRMERRGGDTSKIFKGVAGKAKGNIA